MKNLIEINFNTNLKLIEINDENCYIIYSNDIKKDAIKLYELQKQFNMHINVINLKPFIDVVKNSLIRTKEDEYINNVKKMIEIHIKESF